MMLAIVQLPSVLGSSVYGVCLLLIIGSKGIGHWFGVSTTSYFLVGEKSEA